jgi:hypothetical protein
MPRYGNDPDVLFLGHQKYVFAIYRCLVRYITRGGIKRDVIAVPARAGGFSSEGSIGIRPGDSIKAVSGLRKIVGHRQRLRLAGGLNEAEGFCSAWGNLRGKFSIIRIEEVVVPEVVDENILIRLQKFLGGNPVLQ